MFRKIMSIFLILSICHTQIYAFSQQAEYVVKYAYLQNNVNKYFAEKHFNDKNSFNSALPGMINDINNFLFNNNIEEVSLEIINKTVNDSVELKKRTEFIPKQANTLMNQDDSAFGKAYELGYADDDGIYVGFLENHLSAVSRGYYAKKYSNFNKEDGIKKDYIVLGKANFLEDIATALYDYKINSKHSTIQPLLLSYFNYVDTYANFNEPDSYKENSFGWNGLLRTDVGNPDLYSIKQKLNSFASPITTMEKRDFGTLIGGSNKVFNEDGRVFHYKTKEFNEELFGHISMANTYMANNNLKRGYILAPSKNLNNYHITNHQRCSGKIRKRCYYWQNLNYTGGMDVYTMSFLDETYMDDWSNISYLNRNIITGSVVVPTMVPVNSYAKLPSVNSENYGLLYSSNYAGSIGGHGLYSFPLFGISGLNGTERFVKSAEFKKSGWTMLAIIIAVVVTGVLVGGITGIVVAVIMYQDLLKSSNQGKNAQNLNEQENRTVTDLANSVLIQAEDEEKAKELLDSSVLYGIMSNVNNYNLNKNFMSNTYHNEASKYAKNNLSEVSSSFFETSIPILDALDQGTKFWKSAHKEALISGYRNAFANDGRNMIRSGGYASFYDMRAIFRDITREYIGY